MTLEEARDAFMAAFDRVCAALKELEKARAAENKAREVYRALWDKQNESIENGQG